jgi:hypothetical protein
MRSSELPVISKMSGPYELRMQKKKKKCNIMRSSKSPVISEMSGPSKLRKQERNK